MVKGYALRKVTASRFRQPSDSRAWRGAFG